MTTFAPEKLSAQTGGRWTALPSGELTGFTQDTRSLAAGQVFVALKTDKRDGHDFLDEAATRGASAALVGREMPSPLPQLVVSDPLGAFQAIARHHRQACTAPVVGVSGSVGKTSTKDLLALLLGGEPEVLATVGNLNNHLGVPLTLTKLAATHRAAVIEAGIGGPGEMAPLAAMIAPDHAIVTHVGPAHLEKLGSLAGVAAEKVQLLTAVRSGGLQVFPASCLIHASFAALPNALVLVPENESMTRVLGRRVRFNVFHRPDRTELTLDGTRRFLLRRVSSGMAQNAALALALAGELGVSDAQLQARVAAWQPSKWRGELRQIGAAAVYCDFYNANPASMADGIDVFNGLAGAGQSRMYVLGCMEELGAESASYHQALGRGLHLRPGDALFAIGDQADALREGLMENGNDPTQISVLTDLGPVRERLATFAGAVFLKGSRRYHLESVLSADIPAHA